MNNMVLKDNICTFEYKTVVFTFNPSLRMSLGDEVAECPMKNREELKDQPFDPINNAGHQSICLKVCKVMRLNKEIEKYGIKRLQDIEKINLRMQEKKAIREGKESIALRNDDMI